MDDRKKQLLKKLPHIIAGVVILLHALERYETGHGTWVFFAIAALIFLSIAAFHHRLAHRFPYIDTTFYIIEAMLSLLISFEYYHAGKKLLPVAYIVAAMMQMVAVYVVARKKRKAGAA